MNRYITVETLQGRGAVIHKGRRVAEDVEYSIDVTQQLLDTTGPTEIRGPKITRGSINLFSSPTLRRLQGEPIELEIQDRRRLPCYIASRDGSVTALRPFIEP